MSGMALDHSPTPSGLIDEIDGLTTYAAAARFFSCSMFELIERPDREEWVRAWERAQAAQRRLDDGSV